MTDQLSYRLVIHDRNMGRASEIPAIDLMNADLVVGKDRRVLKDRYGAEGTTLSRKRLEDIMENADETRIR